MGLKAYIYTVYKKGCKVFGNWHEHVWQNSEKTDEYIFQNHTTWEKKCCGIATIYIYIKL